MKYIYFEPTFREFDENRNSRKGKYIGIDSRLAKIPSADSDFGEEEFWSLISMDDWEAIQETLFLLSIPKMRESIRRGLKTPVDDCATELPW